jgi:hypothetical protein
MDPKVNLKEQIELAKQIIEIEDHNDDDTCVVADLGLRLAELVLALHEWQRKGGFSPYAKLAAAIDDPMDWNPS